MFANSEASEMCNTDSFKNFNSYSTIYKLIDIHFYKEISEYFKESYRYPLFIDELNNPFI